MHAFILAGGFATRLWPLTEKRAKPLLRVGGKPLVEYIVDSIPSQMPITISTNAVFAEDFEEWKKTIKGKNISILIEDAGHEDQKLGALGATAKWVKEQKIQDDILLLAGDNYCDFPLQKFLESFNGNPLILGYDVKSKETAQRFGTIIVEEKDQKTVVEFEEKPLRPHSTIVSTGWSILPKSTVQILHEYAKVKPDNIGGIFEEFLRQELPVECKTFDGLWKDIGSFESYIHLHQCVVGEKVLADTSAKIEGSILKGSIDLGAKTIVRNSTLTDCIIMENTIIDDCILERCIIDSNCSLKGVDFCDQMLRSGTVLT